jgi:DNA-binding NtrC family response regulator
MAGGRLDDEPIVGSTAKAILERAGHPADVVSGGQQALDRLSESPGAYALVLLDLTGLDGEQTFQAIRQIAPELPVVIRSGYSDSEVRGSFQGRSVSGFLHKPYHSRTLAGKVSELLGSGWRR